jgi:hypothetical protein
MTCIVTSTYRYKRPPTYKVRFEFRTAVRFSVSDAEFEFKVADLPAYLRSFDDGRPLNESDVAVIHVGGFPDQSKAREFGLRLHRAATLASTRTDFGVDIGASQAHPHPKVKSREAILKETGILIRDHAFGIDVYDETTPTTILSVSGLASVRRPPQNFLKALDESFRVWPQSPGKEVELALRLRAEANMATDGLARLVLAITSVETLTPEEFWSDQQTEVLNILEETARNCHHAPVDEIEEIIERITKQRKLTVSESFRRLLRQIGLFHLWPRWRKVYSVRSKILHGHVPPDHASAALSDAMALSKEIVLAATSLRWGGNSLGG